MTTKTLLLLFCISITAWGSGDPAVAQARQTTVDFSGIISSSGTTPFWIDSNRFGIYSRSGSQLMTRIQTHGTAPVFKSEHFRLQYGADLVARPAGEQTLSLNQAYLKIEAYAFEIVGGRFHTRSPIHDERLSMGSLGVSGNATPVPQVRAGLADWTGVPFTNSFVKIRAHLSHGWVGGRRYTDDVLYHEKVGHLRFGGDLPINLYGGIAHYAFWGGNDNPDLGDLPAGVEDFGRVFFALGGDERAPEPEANFMLGDHLGAWNFGMLYNTDLVKVNVYRQHPLETKDNLKLKSLQDALNGISFRFDDALGWPVKGVVYEYLYTKWQDGPRTENILDDGTRCSQVPERCRDLFQGNENYYNHFIYRTGWAHYGRTIGNPLFRRSSTPLDRLDDGIDNNRIIAHHIGVEAGIQGASVVGKFTVSRNFGTRDDPFPEPVDQISIGINGEVPVRIGDRAITILADAAWDNGSLFGDQVGLLLGLRWTSP
ncbi:MAG: hypothetical protein GVY08_12380 [Bacteroidetes bacterium]|jgi:hypothetical protein|nr:hypothetical protein [Bacteroidota bacterium]